MATDLYQELGVSRTASQDEIKKAYRKLAAKLHPDKKPGDKRAEARFKALNRAYQVLSDPQKRSLYDEFGDDALRESFNAEAARAYRQARAAGGRVHFPPGGSGGFDFSEVFAGRGGMGGMGDLFGDLFGGRRRRAPAKGSDVASEITVDFVSAIRGTSLDLRVQDNGNAVTVRIPPGAGDGEKLRVKGQGAPGQFGGPPGDLVLVIRVRPHTFFERDGLDLYLDLPITVGEAYHGTKVVVPTPDGNVTLTVPKRAQSGQVARLRGRGVKRKNQSGDLFVRFFIRLPDAENDEIEDAVDTLAEATTADIRAGIVF